MKFIYKTVLLIIVFSQFLNFNSKAQCSYLIPSNVHVISSDSSINNSFLPAQQFLICPTVTLTVYGNSTGFNKFYLEGGATVIFSDSMGQTPYGSYSFYVKSGATLHYNASSPVAFPFIDTLVWDAGATLIDTGSLFYDTTVCNPLVFDYSLIGGVPCGTSGSNIISDDLVFSISPNPFTNALKLSVQNSSTEISEVIIYNLLGVKLEHFYLNDAINSEFEMKNKWNGIAILEIRNMNRKIHFEKIIRQ